MMPKTRYCGIAQPMMQLRMSLRAGRVYSLRLLQVLSDNLSRFYSSAVLDHVHRSQALEEWSKLSKGESISLEKALGGFDLFVLHNERGDLHEVSSLPS